MTQVNMESDETETSRIQDDNQNFKNPSDNNGIENYNSKENESMNIITNYSAGNQLSHTNNTEKLEKTNAPQSNKQENQGIADTVSDPSSVNELKQERSTLQGSLQPNVPSHDDKQTGNQEAADIPTNPNINETPIGYNEISKGVPPKFQSQASEQAFAYRQEIELFPNDSNSSPRNFHLRKNNVMNFDSNCNNSELLYPSPYHPQKSKGGYCIFVSGLPENVLLSNDAVLDMLLIERFNEQLSNTDPIIGAERRPSPRIPNIQLIKNSYLEIKKVVVFQHYITGYSMGQAIVKVKVRLQEMGGEYNRNFLYPNETNHILQRFIAYIQSISYEKFEQKGNLNADYTFLIPPQSRPRKHHRSPHNREFKRRRME